MSLVYRAGTGGGPTLDLSGKSEVWLIKDPRLYYPLHQNKNAKKQDQRQRKGGSTNVYLWEAVIDPSKLHLQVEDHPQFKDVCLVSFGNPQRVKELESLPWKKAEVPECHGGMSFIDFNPLLQAIVEYMKDNYPSTPQQFNFQAELKVVSHWHWPEDKEVPRRKSDPHNDFRIKKAVEATLNKWRKDLRDLQSKPSDASFQEYISGLEEDTLALRAYFKKGELEEDEAEDKGEDDTMAIELTEDDASTVVSKYAKAGLGWRSNGYLPSDVEISQKRRSGKRARQELKNGEMN